MKAASTASQRVDVGEIALDDLPLVALRPAAEVAAHRVDGLEAGLPEERLGAAPVLLGERRAGEVDAHARARVRAMDETPRSTEFVALGHAGSEHYAGIETFPNPGVSHVQMTSDELVAVCPITGQPDLYVAAIDYWPRAALHRVEVAEALPRGLPERGRRSARRSRSRSATTSRRRSSCRPTRCASRSTQKPRGGITIVATT